MKRACLAASALLGVLLAGCGGGPSVTKGVVIDHAYRAPYTSTWFMPISTGKSVVLIPEMTYHPANWQLELKDCSQKPANGPCPTGWVDVDQQTYDSTSIGASYGGQP